MRLVDVDEALRLFGEEYEKTKELIHNGESQLDSLAEGFTEAHHIIKYVLPTVDAVPVVRCKDCVHWNDDPDTYNAGAAMAMQFAMDTLQMALHQTEGWGYDRIMRITHNWIAVQREYKPALDCRNPEADVRQEHMDRVLAEIIRDKAKLIPFPDRYKDLKKIRYGR